MARIALKNILGKKNDSTQFLLSFIEQLGTPICVEDENGKLLLGNVHANEAASHVVMFEDENIGVVKGDENGILVANLLVHLLNKEIERKKLGSEVLNLYKEVNLIFNFSEKLSQTIDAASISRIALDEAGRIVNADNGVLVLWNENSNQLQVLASLGEMFFDEEKINSELPLLLKIILSGQSEILSDLHELHQASIVLPQVQSIIYAALKVNQRVMGAIILASPATEQYTAADLKLLTTISLQASSAIESALLFEKNIKEAKDREDALRKVYDATAKFVPVEFIDALGHQLITEVKLGDHAEKIVTVLFSDIRDFTGISEKMTPEENFRFVCSFNERMGPIIKKYGGFINQYLGDAIMAIFPGNAADALAAAVEMQQEVAVLNEHRSAANQPLIHIGVGMHTGPLIMGITGDNDRMDATTISDTVNTASRIESLTKQYKASIILSDASLQQIAKKENFLLRHLGSVQLKGKQKTVKIHECFSANVAMDKQLKLETMQLFDEGVMHFVNNAYLDACNAFTKAMALHPADQTAHVIYTMALQHLEKETAN